ncbi:hypothetical protein SETIT_8G165800v2 [Setaria italica]|uniref:Uncharacterized protein n=1 Tax=Setaria italica TaxID=4555 RepID=A0A368S8H1_SETIT|nr:hypothetical protein SETIT_8G165800v2 [Setaria italica]
MEGKRTTALMVIMCLVILSLNVNPAPRHSAAAAPDFICKNTCCFPCTLSDSVAAKMEEMGVLAKMEEAGQA